MPEDPTKIDEALVRQASKTAPYAFSNDGQIYVNNRAGRRNFKKVWRAAIEHKTGIGGVLKPRYFTQHIPTKSEIRARRKAERKNRGK